jgi:hypothetical protein
MQANYSPKKLPGPLIPGFLVVAVFMIVILVPARGIGQSQSEISASQNENFSESVARRRRRVEPETAPATMRTARIIYVRCLSALISAEDIENKLRKHPDFQRYGMLITRQESDADLILEVKRGVLTKFVFTAIEPQTLVVVASGKLSSLGGTVDGKVAKLFMKQVVQAREEAR